MQKSSWYFLFMVVLMIGLVCTQSSDSPSSNELVIGVGQTVSIGAGQRSMLQLAINRKIGERQNLYITGESPFNDPFQEPRITVTSENNFNLKCSEESNDFIGICQIENKDIIEGRIFNVSFYCQVDCKLFVFAYLSQAYQVQLGQTFTLRNLLQTPMVQSSLIQIPKDADFTQIMIIGTPSNLQNRVEATIMVATYGQQPPIPTTTVYFVKGQSVSQHRLGIFLSSDDVKPGDKIYVLYIIAPNTQIQISTNMGKNNVYHLFIGYDIYDYTPNAFSRVYVLDLKEYQDKNQIYDQILQIKFISYTGFPSVEVAFDEEFSKQKSLDSFNGDYASSFSIPSNIRLEKGYTGKVYIRVTSYWSCNYYLGAFVNRKPFIDMEPHFAEIIRIEENAIKNLIFTDENYVSDIDDDGMVDYKITINVASQEMVEFMIRDCGAYKNGNVLECIINDTKELTEEVNDKSFKQIQFSKDYFYDAYIIKFSYNVTEKCPSVGNGTTQKKYVCKYQIVLTNLNSTGYVNTMVEMVKNTVQHQLREGISQKGTVQKSQFNYYSFYLPSVENIVSLSFFITVIQGDVFLFVSREIKYPSFDDFIKVSDIMIGFSNSVLITQEDLKVGMYYIGVFGHSMTDFTIGVAISRKKSSDSATNDTEIVVSEIILQRGQIQTYTMPQNTTISKFVFTVLKDGQMSSIKINEIQGDVSYVVNDREKVDQMKCDSRILKASQQDYCEFVSSVNHSYVVTVRGVSNQTQLFSIVYTSGDVCNTYPWNYPLFISVVNNETICFTYKVYQLSDIHISLGLSSLQILTSKIDISLKFYQKQIVNITNRDKIISESQLSLLCAYKKTYCSFNLYIKNMDNSSNLGNSPVGFMMAVQNMNRATVLFDGVVTKIATDKISQSHSQKFYYYLFNLNAESYDFCIFLQSQTASNYRIAMRVVKNSQFVMNPQQELFPKFDDRGNGTVVVDTDGLMAVTSVKLDKEVIDGYKAEGEGIVILISVFGIPPSMIAQGSVMYVFKIEASLGSSSLELGNSKVGFVEKDTIFQYEIEVSDSVDSSIEIRELDSVKCVQSYISDPLFPTSPKQFTKSNPFSKQSGKRNILIKTNANFCTFQISYRSLSVPITVIQVSTPYQVSISNNEIKYFVYYHGSKSSFYILQMITAGSSILYATTITEEDSLEGLLKGNVSGYNFVGEMNADLEISQRSQRFCSGCYYVIAVKGSAVVESELIINPSGVPILLKVGALMRDRVELDEEIVYQVYSASGFNISLNILYGRVEISVSDPSGGEVSRLVIAAEKEVVVAGQNISSSSMNPEYFDEKSRYLIKIKAVEVASYYITVKKKQVGKILYEGVPSNLQLKSNQLAKISFDNIQSQGTINILIQDLNYYQNVRLGEFTIHASVENYQNVLKKISSSQSSTSVQLLAQRGTYNFDITSKVDTTISLLWTKNQFTHLTSGRTFLMNQPTTFEIFSPGDSIIIEVYLCKGDIEIQASVNYSQLSGDRENNQGVVQLEHSNYGGHYVISAENLKGEYFIKLNRQQEDNNTELKYIISYHLYNPSLGEKMPYKIYGLGSSQIRYRYGLQIVQFILSRVSRRDNGPIQGNITYKLYISNNSDRIDQMTKCSLGQVFASIKVVDGNSRGMVVFQYNVQQIWSIIGNSEVYFVGAEATIHFGRNSTEHVGEANFVYEVSQLMMSNTEMTKIVESKRSSFQQYKNLILWVILPFLCGCILLYFAAKYLLRSFSSYPTQLVEQEEQHQTQSTGGLQSQTQSDNISDEIK